MKETTNRLDNPLIYHLDVASMYPNIILTNRLQPSAMVKESDCAVCDHNRPGKNCQRKMTWSWRGEMYTAEMREYRMILKQLESERFPVKEKFEADKRGTMMPKTMVPYHDLPPAEQHLLLTKRLSEYCQKNYRRVKRTEVVSKQSIVCQRENSFYIDTVRGFRDRRYDYKNLQKVAKKRLDEAAPGAQAEEANKLVILYESLQLAHKCILNSFYGYVMRKGARWYSMEMAGIVCETGAAIIRLARGLVEKIGRPLELDTDGIWCMLPGIFPQYYAFQTSNGKKHSFAYPCIMINHLVHDLFTNDQYQTLQPDGSYRVSSENSIFFEIDGPYRAMVVPSSMEEGKLLKKRYAVFNHDGSLAELKGFEIKRRGELRIIKAFQQQIFKHFLEGDTLPSCYAKVAEVANYWLDVLYSRGAGMEDTELLDLISENRSMSRSLADYGEQKSTSICTAKRLAEFLGEAMVKDAGLACKFVISQQPQGQPVANRAIPVAIFSAEPAIRQEYLRRWLADPSFVYQGIRSLLDWPYYLERIESMICKLIVIPAALQQVPNPVPRVKPPEWLAKVAADQAAHRSARQSKLPFTKIARDIEDLSQPLLKREEAAVEILPAIKPPNPEVDYVGWLQVMKGRWRVHRQQQRQAGGFKGSLRQRNEALLLTEHAWQILSVQPASTPGLFTLTLWLGGQLRQTTVKVDRRLVLHCREALSPEAAQHLQLVHQRLPFGGDRGHLYELIIPEANWQAMPHLMAPLLEASQVEAVYEARLPLDFSLLADIGCCARVEQALDCYAPAQLQFQTSAMVPYLTNSMPRWVSLAHYTGPTQDGRHLLVLHVSGSEEVQVVVVDSGLRRQLPTSLGSLWPSSLEASKVYSLPTVPIMQVNYFAELQQAQRHLQRILSPLAGTMVCLHQGLVFDFVGPSITCPPHDPFTLPALDWQRQGVRRAFEWLGGLPTWLTGRLELARYGHVPLGNLPASPQAAQSLLFDLFLARQLRRQGYLLPDQFHEPGNYSQAQPPLLTTPKPGVYRHVCVEVALGNVLLNAIAEHAALVAEAEEELSVPPLLPVLAQMTQQLAIAWHKGNPHAQSLLASLPRLLLGGASRLACGPRLVGCLEGLMHRSLTLLIGRLRSLGLGLIAGDQGQLLIRTSKTSGEGAATLLEWAISTLREEACWSWMTLTPVRYWQLLVWLDQGNYGGVLHVREGDGGLGEVEQRWLLQEYLPPILQRPFSLLLASLLKGLVSQQEHEAKPSPTELGFFVAHDDATTEQQQQQEEEEQSQLRPPPQWSQSLLQTVAEAQAILSRPPLSEADELARLTPPWPQPVCEDAPALRFGRYLSAILQLMGMNSLSTSVFRLLGVGEWSPAAQYQSPIVSMITPAMACHQCGWLRSVMDWAIDEDLRPCILRGDEIPDTIMPCCPSCQARYAPREVETSLLAYWQQSLIAYQQQDLACVKCRWIRDSPLAAHCSRCGHGQFNLTLQPQPIQRQMLRHIAEKLKLPLLSHQLERA